jgi:hypothetical protein
MGGEDVDFPLGIPVTTDTTAAHFNAGFARCALQNTQTPQSAVSRSAPFPGGTVTSCWLHFVLYNQGTVNSTLGLGQSGLAAANAGLFVGAATGNSTKVGLYKFDGTTMTLIASESGTSLTNNAKVPIDVQVTSYGATATINVYCNGVLVITFSGDPRAGSQTAIDTVLLNGGTFSAPLVSEIIVSDTDTRTMRLVTHAPNAAGDVNNWTNAYTNINGTTFSDTSVVYVNTTGQDLEANLIDLPSGTWQCYGVKEVVRAAVTNGATPTGVKIGVKSGGTVSVPAATTLVPAFLDYERYMATNPVTSAAWTQADLNALQCDIQSA